MGRIVGGFMCAMHDCHNNTGLHRHLSFFRFPSNPERAKLWQQACGMKKDVSAEKLYKNYRVCSKHFAPYMFLNNLRNRLQPHAIPRNMKADALSTKIIYLTTNFTGKLDANEVHLPHQIQLFSSTSKILILNTRLPNQKNGVHIKEDVCTPISSTDMPSKLQFSPTSNISTINTRPTMEQNDSLTENNETTSPVDIKEEFIEPSEEDSVQIPALLKELEKLKNENLQLQEESRKLREGVSQIFNEDQLHCLRQGSLKEFEWSEETLRKAYRLRLSCGSTGYDLLREMGQPLPAQHTLQRRIENMNCLHELLQEEPIMLELKEEPIDQIASISASYDNCSKSDYDSTSN